MNMTLTKALTFRMFAVNEMICLWETLFPDSHNLFQMHQIMDLVSSIVSKQKMMRCRGIGGIGGSGRDGGGGTGPLTGNGTVPVNLLFMSFLSC